MLLSSITGFDSSLTQRSHFKHKPNAPVGNLLSLFFKMIFGLFEFLIFGDFIGKVIQLRVTFI